MKNAEGTRGMRKGLDVDVHFGPVSDGEEDWWELVDLGEPDEESILPGPDVYEGLGFDPDDEFGPEEGGEGPPGADE